MLFLELHVAEEEDEMAYSQEIARRCQRCGGRASVEVFNNRNGSCGVYCARCGKAKLKEVQRQEDLGR